MKVFKFNVSTITAMVFSLTVTPSVNAYYYEEHKLISQIALEIAIKHKMVEIDAKRLKKAIRSNFICDDIMDPTPSLCITLADLPALAGDHAGSPMLLQWKWLNDSRSAPWFFGVSDYLASTRIFFDHGCESSETTVSKIPAREDFIEVVHRSPGATTFGETNEIIDHDSNYIRSAAHNCNHFRNIENLSPGEYEESLTDSYSTTIWSKSILPFRRNERTRLKPKLESDSWYSQLHASALELAARKGENNLAAAWIFETFALHFLQDGTASGHIITPNFGGTSVLKTKSLHDKLSKDGLKVSIENACRALNSEYQVLKVEFPRLKEACNEDNFETTIFGDRNLVKRDLNSATKDLAVFLTTVSLSELGNAFKSGRVLVQLDESKNDYSDPHWTFQGQLNDDLARTLFTWWESGGTTYTNKTPMADAATKHLEQGALKAIKLWPKAL